MRTYGKDGEGVWLTPPNEAPHQCRPPATPNMIVRAPGSRWQCKATKKESGEPCNRVWRLKRNDHGTVQWEEVTRGEANHD